MSNVTPLPVGKSATSPQDVGLLRLHAAFDEITETMVQDAHHTEDVKKALDLIKWTRTHTIQVFLKNAAE